MAHADEMMGLVLEELGPAAYGVYWLILEDISAPMEPGRMLPSATHSDAKWAQICFCSARVYKSIGQKLSELGLIVMTSVEGRTKIEIPNILKYKDEYSKKSGQAPEKVRTNSGAKQIQSRADTEQIQTSASSEVLNSTAQEEPPEPPIPKTPKPKTNAKSTSEPVAINREASRRAMEKTLEDYGWMRQALLDYPGADVLPGKPDDAIVKRCLDIGSHDQLALREALMSMAHAYKRPELSWAWFPTVLPQYFQARDGPEALRKIESNSPEMNV